MTITDLQPLCDPSRDDIKTPWTWNGFTYATNGRIAVRLDGAIEGVERRESFSAKIDEHVSAKPDAWKPLDFSKLPPATQEPCLGCNSKGYFVSCKECDGVGEIACSECGHESDCKACGGNCHIPSTLVEGATSCDECDGKCTHPVFVKVRFGKHVIDSKYLHLLATFSGVELGEGFNDTVAIRFDGGFGIVRPMNGVSKEGLVEL